MSGVAVRRAVVTGREPLRVRLLGGPNAGEVYVAVCPPEFGSEPEVGREVAVNTVGVEMELGTGGAVFILPEPGDSECPENDDHFVKLPYTPIQFPARMPKTPNPKTPNPETPNPETPLSGIPVVVLPLHSHLAVACCAAARSRPGCRVAFVWQEGGALPVELSESVRRLRGRGLLDSVVSSGACFGGDLEAPNIYAAMEIAASMAEIVMVGIGPGVVGTNTRYGNGGMSVAVALNAAVALGGEPVLAPRLSAADARERHRGVSHHTRTALSATLSGCRVAFPESGRRLAGSDSGRHEYVFAAGSAGGLEEEFGVIFRSMGRGYEQDGVFFDAAAAAVEVALAGGLR